jgi:hypothetical protein
MGSASGVWRRLCCCRRSYTRLGSFSDLLRCWALNRRCRGGDSSCCALMSRSRWCALAFTLAATGWPETLGAFGTRSCTRTSGLRARIHAGWICLRGPSARRWWHVWIESQTAQSVSEADRIRIASVLLLGRTAADAADANQEQEDGSSSSSQQSKFQNSPVTT